MRRGVDLSTDDGTPNYVRRDIMYEMEKRNGKEACSSR